MLSKPAQGAQGPLRILQASRVYWPNLGGIEKIAQGLAEHLVRRGHHVDVVTLDRSFEDNSPYPPTDFHHGVSIRRVPFRGSTRYPLAPGVVRGARDYDLIHVHAVDFLLDAFVATKPWHRRPVLLTTHGGFFHTERHRALKTAWFHTLTRATLTGVDRVLCVSDHDLELFSRLSARCVITPNAVDLAPFLDVKSEPVPGRFVTVGRVDVHKGLGHLLFTLERLRAIDPRPFRLDVLGPEVVPGLLEKLRAQARSLGLHDVVHFRGKVEQRELYAALAQAELALFPSEYEAFGISVVEAMAAGVVPVLNDIGAFRSFVGDRDGFLTDFAQPAQAAEVLRRARALGPERPLWSESARRSARRFDWESTVDRYEALYREVLAERGRRARRGSLGASEDAR